MGGGGKGPGLFIEAYTIEISELGGGGGGRVRIDDFVSNRVRQKQAKPCMIKIYSGVCTTRYVP